MTFVPIRDVSVRVERPLAALGARMAVATASLVENRLHIGKARRRVGANGGQLDVTFCIDDGRRSFDGVVARERRRDRERRGERQNQESEKLTRDHRCEL